MCAFASGFSGGKMDSQDLRSLIAIVVMILIYSVLVFSKTRKANRGTKK